MQKAKKCDQYQKKKKKIKTNHTTESVVQDLKTVEMTILHMFKELEIRMSV